jgi:DNA or RNA helicases of superfamily II
MLRDYQQDMYNKIQHELRYHNGVCAVLPCRSGKSYIMKAIVEAAAEKNKNVLILAHRNILLEQHRKLINNCRIVSVFTEVNHLGENGVPDLIIIDEAHLSNANSYIKVCEYYKCKRILFTATACRLDGKPLVLADVIINGFLLMN